jgi:Acetyltransferase (GNAT) domain
MRSAIMVFDQIGNLPATDRATIDRLAHDADEPFLYTRLLEVYERQQGGITAVRHYLLYRDHELVAYLPLYRPDHCARLAYYKYRLAQAFAHPVWLCGHLYGWYASPLAIDTAALDRLLDVVLHEHRDALVMFPGLAAGHARLHHYRQRGFLIRRFHSTTCKPLARLDRAAPYTDVKASYRWNVRSTLQKARQAGCHCRLASEPEERRLAAAMMSANLDRIGVAESVMPRTLLRAWVEGGRPHQQLLLARQADLLLGAALTLETRGHCYIWLAGVVEKGTYPFSVTNYMFHGCIEYAMAHGFQEIEGGRSPYQPKKQHGMAIAPIYCAAYSRNAAVLRDADCWLRGLEQRHLAQYAITE